MNHFEDFCTYVNSKSDVLSETFRADLIARLNAAMQDAFKRGKQEGRRETK